MKRVFGAFEAAFDIGYLLAALVFSFVLLLSGGGNPARLLAGGMALILVSGDAFHLVPRILVILTGEEERLRIALGWGKQITSITMTFFYLLLWEVARLAFYPAGGGVWPYLIYSLAALRILLCLLPQNGWQERYPPQQWGIRRNVPFFLLGIAIAGFFFAQRKAAPGLSWMWLAILLSFAFYLPVVLWSNQNPKVGMLMLPKTCAYLWMLAMCLSL